MSDTNVHQLEGTLPGAARRVWKRGVRVTPANLVAGAAGRGGLLNGDTNVSFVVTSYSIVD
jgi:hypothetical protein